MKSAGGSVRRDNLTPAQRSYTMSRIRSKDTALERSVMEALRLRGLRFTTHAVGLPGRPDILFRKERVVVFINGDFWHGYRYPAWKKSLSEWWQAKIERNRARDRRTAACLRRKGYYVVKVWQHQVKRDLDAVADRIVRTLEDRRTLVPPFIGDE